MHCFHKEHKNIDGTIKYCNNKPEVFVKITNDVYSKIMCWCIECDTTFSSIIKSIQSSSSQTINIEYLSEEEFIKIQRVSIIS